MYCPSGNATDPIWIVLASCDRISSWTPLKPQHIYIYIYIKYVGSLSIISTDNWSKNYIIHDLVWWQVEQERFAWFVINSDDGCQWIAVEKGFDNLVKSQAGSPEPNYLLSVSQLVIGWKISYVYFWLFEKCVQVLSNLVIWNQKELEMYNKTNWFLLYFR